MKKLFISEAASIKECLKLLDVTAEKILLVVDDQNRLLGTLTDGDVRRCILKGKDLDSTIQDSYHQNSLHIKKDDFTVKLAQEILLTNKVMFLPILDSQRVVVDYINWERAFSGNQPVPLKQSITIPVVIIAGGKGSRLEPFTNVLPKGLIPIGDKTIMEIIINEFLQYGIKNFHFALNFKAEMIKAYFDGIDREYSISYVYETKFQGTAGGLSLLKDQIADQFIVSNCDVIVKADYADVFKFHNDHHAVLTILSSIQHHKVPYGIIDFADGGEVIAIREKPEYSFPINTGVYLLDKECLPFIPENCYFDMTDLIQSLLKSGKKVVTYPVNNNDYIDIGQWKEYHDVVRRLESF